ncbi:MAG: HEAT repeat domain-containing protein [Anaerolineae bacterium]|nr:HEAT repeat domain-containing protein [Anaerolineae bacterium]
MRRLLNWLLLLALGAASALTIIQPAHPAATVSQIILAAILVIILLDRIFGWFRLSRATPSPPSQIAEMERLYFRCMREMINDEPNLVQVINDLQRILAIDPGYKNARHYLNRAILIQNQSQGLNGVAPVRSRNSAEFRKLQDQLIDTDPAVRKGVVMELIQYGEDAIDPLIALLMDEDSDVRIHAATALGWVGGKDAVQPLLVALQDTNTYVRRYSARALCWVVDESAIEGLIQALADPDSYVRQYSARALGWSQDRRAIRPLVELLMIEEVNDVREYTFTALADLGEPHVRIDRPIKLEE